ncbi:MAG: hypothetical protein KC635_25300, partial [Myxococcales bacterium]|nr:hypothetical protein [Myxococcales bacterium]
APSRPLAVRATFRGADPDRAELLVTSTTMDMGETAIPLARVAPGELAGEGALPVCVTREMTWLADLHLPGRDAPVASFRFDTHTRQP